MNLKSLLFAALIAGLSMLYSCGGGGGVSPTTGLTYGDPDNGGFEVPPYVEQQTGPGLVLIEGGAFTMGRVEQDLTYDWNNMPRRATINSFYIDETEVRNVDYREYLFWIYRIYYSDYPEVYNQARPDTLVWRRPLAFNEPLVEYYFRHPAYHDYPVVGVSWVQANNYCGWRTDRVNEKLLVDEGILEPDPNQTSTENFNTDAYLAGLYIGTVKGGPKTPDGEERPVRMEDGILLPKYRLPTEAEWEYAAVALVGNSYDERVYDRRLYPWNGSYLRNDGKDDRGRMNANFQRGRGDMMGIAGALNDGASIPNRVDAYWPNDYGLYCMAGNVNEWVLDVYRPLSFFDVDEYSPYRGNVFEVKQTDEEGNIAERDSLGRIRYRPITDAEAMNRHNYHRADNRNYDDGDVRSSIIPGGDYMGTPEQADPSASSHSTRMYFTGKGDNNDKATSLVSDESRVYKGGSWRDRAYWLIPGNRRFLDQNKSSDDLGFRCAMIRVGGTAAQY